jgi:DNA-binding MarR family transcriptional regulator
MTFKNPIQDLSRRAPNTGGASGSWISDAGVSTLHRGQDAPVDRCNLNELAKKIKEVRSVRSEVFAPELFGEPAWDLLLALYTAAGGQYRMKVTAACIESNVPETTALRWLSSLGEAGLIRFDSNPSDARSRYVALSGSGVAMMDHLMRFASGSFRLV